MSSLVGHCFPVLLRGADDEGGVTGVTRLGRPPNPAKPGETKAWNGLPSAVLVSKGLSRGFESR